jgi:hypothetical protein
VGEILLFPAWRVITRAEGSMPGEPRALVDPRGRRVEVEEVVRRRLVAVSDSSVPAHHEIVVRAGGKLYVLRWVEGEGGWAVCPA